MTRDALQPAIEAALEQLPAGILARSGSIFYSGRAAFAAPAHLYILGLNPGGSPVIQSGETVELSLSRFRHGAAAWSAYSDESWCGAPPGTWGMQPRVLHLLRRVRFDPRAVPASNVVFVRTSTEAALEAEKANLLRACWLVHQAVIDTLEVRVVVCLGITAGRWVRDALGATELVDAYVEENARRWRSETHQAKDGRRVVTLTHPGRADWRNPQADPTTLVQRALAELGRS